MAQSMLQTEAWVRSLYLIGHFIGIAMFTSKCSLQALFRIENQNKNRKEYCSLIKNNREFL